MLEELGQSVTLSSLNHEKILRALQIPYHSASLSSDSCAQLLEQIHVCEEEVLRVARPRAVLRVLPVADLQPVISGQDIRRLLDGCSEAVLMALSLGSELERRLMREEVIDMSNAYLLDVCASQAVEDAADELERRIRTQICSDGKYLTNRYSPGYGDFPLEVQKLLLDYLNAVRAIGLTLTPTSLMVPRKSITAVMGISDRPKPDVYGGCAHCPLFTKCSWGEHGDRCYDVGDKQKGISHE